MTKLLDRFIRPEDIDFGEHWANICMHLRPGIQVRILLDSEWTYIFERTEEGVSWTKEATRVYTLTAQEEDIWLLSRLKELRKWVDDKGAVTYQNVVDLAIKKLS